MFEELLPAVLQTLTIALITGIAALVKKNFSKLKGDFDSLKRSQRQQIKAQLVATYETCVRKGYITPMELDTSLRLFESYVDLGGNTYIETLVNRLKTEMPIEGEHIPDYEERA